MFRSVGIIGSGAVGQAVARRCLAAGIPVVLSNSRGPASLGGIVSELGEAAAAGTVRRAADAELVVLAVPFVTVPDVGEQVDDWSGRVVVDATNQFAQYQPSYAGRVDLGSETGSEWVARRLPGATSSRRSTPCSPSTSRLTRTTTTAGRWCSTPETITGPTLRSPRSPTPSDSPRSTSGVCPMEASSSSSMAH
jgi:NADP oxidoreductase coenzyme F420-dependent